MVLKRLFWQQNWLRGLLKDVDLMWYMLKLKVMTGEEPTASRFESTAKELPGGTKCPLVWIGLKKCPILIGCCSRPPNTCDNFYDLLENSLENATKKQHHTRGRL